MKHAILIKYKSNYWMVADLFIIGDKAISAININKHYRLDENYVYIYSAMGGSGTGFQQGELLHKIFIGDCSFETFEFSDKKEATQQLANKRSEIAKILNGEGSYISQNLTVVATICNEYNKGYWLGLLFPAYWLLKKLENKNPNIVK